MPREAAFFYLLGEFFGLVVRRDGFGFGFGFEGLRYLAPALAPNDGQPVTIRYDPRDIAEIRVFHRNRFVCCAVSPEHCGQAITLKDIQAERAHHRKALQTGLRDHRRRASGLLPCATPQETRGETGACHGPSESDFTYDIRRVGKDFCLISVFIIVWPTLAAKCLESPTTMALPRRPGVPGMAACR